MSETNSYSNNFSAVRHLFVANSNTSESSSESESIVGICEDYLIDNDSDPSAHDEEHSHASRDWKAESCVHETLALLELNEQALLELEEEELELEQEEEESNEFVCDAQDRAYYTNAAHNFYSAYLEHQNRFEPNSLQHYGIKCNGKPINYVLRQIRGLGASLGVIQLSSLLYHSSSNVILQEHKGEKEEKDEAMKSKTDCKKGLRTRSRSRNIDITTCPTATTTTTTTTNTTQSTLSCGNSNEINNVANVYSNTNNTGVNSTLRTHVVTAMERVRTSIIAQTHTLRRQQHEQQQQLVNQEIRRRENSGTNDNIDENDEEVHHENNNSPWITTLRHPRAPARPSQRYQHQEPFRPLSRLADANKRTSMSGTGERLGMERLRIGRSHGRDNSAIDGDSYGDGDGDSIHIRLDAHTNNGNIQRQEKGYIPHSSNTSHLHNSNNNNNINNETNKSILRSTSCVSNQRIVNTLFEPLLHGTAYKQSESEQVQHHHHHHHSDEASCVECKLDEEASWLALQHSSEWGHLICGEVHVEDWGSLVAQEHVKEQLHLASFLQLYAVILPIPVLSVVQLEVARVSPFDETWSVFNELNTILCCEVASIVRDFIRACPSCQVWLKCDVRSENLTNTTSTNTNNGCDTTTTNTDKYINQYSHLHQFHLLRRALLYGYTVEFNPNTNSAQYIIHDPPLHASEVETNTNIDCIGKLAIVLHFPSKACEEDWEDNKFSTEWLGEHIAAIELNTNAMLAYFRDGITSSNTAHKCQTDRNRRKNEKVKVANELEEEQEEEEEEEENATSVNRQVVAQPSQQKRSKVVIATLKKEIEQQRLLSSYVNMSLLNNNINNNNNNTDNNETRNNGVTKKRPIRQRRQYHIPRNIAELVFVNKNRVRWGSCASFHATKYGNNTHSLYSPRISLFSLFIELLRRRAIPLFTLATEELEQELLYESLEHKANNELEQEEHAHREFFEMYALVNYLHCKFVADDARDAFTPYEDVLQLPLQPLAHQLSNVVYEVFEKDVAKYRQYHMAMMLYMKDWLVSSHNAQSDCLHVHEHNHSYNYYNNYNNQWNEETHHALINIAFLRSLRESHHAEKESEEELRSINCVPIDSNNKSKEHSEIIHEGNVDNSNENNETHINSQNNNNEEEKEEDMHNVMYVVVLGCGRGGLIHECLLAASSLGIRLRIFAIEKNTAAAAFTQMRWKHDSEWIKLANQYKHSLQVICADARYVYELHQRSNNNNNNNNNTECDHNKGNKKTRHVILPADFGLCDLVLSELLGSWGDNELSPECLETFHDQLLRLQESKKIIPNRYLVSIPEHYTAWVAPVYSTYLEDAVAQASLRGLSQPPVNCPNRHVALFHSCFVCNVTRALQLAPAQPVWTFHHFMHMEHMDEALSGCCACRGGGFANLSRRAHVTFEMYPHGRCSGLLGFFTCTLYTSRLHQQATCCTNLNRNHNIHLRSKAHTKQWNNKCSVSNCIRNGEEECECCVKLSTEPNSRTPDLYSWFPCFMPLEPYQTKSLSLELVIPSQPSSLSMERTLRRQQRQEEQQHETGELLEQPQWHSSSCERQRANSKSAYLQLHPQQQFNYYNNNLYSYNNNTLRRSSLCSNTSQSSGSSNHTATTITTQYDIHPFTASDKCSNTTHTTTSIYNNNSKSANTTNTLPCAHNSKSASTTLTVQVERKVDFGTRRVWYTWAVSYDNNNNDNENENEDNDDDDDDKIQD